MISLPNSTPDAVLWEDAVDNTPVSVAHRWGWDSEAEEDVHEVALRIGGPHSGCAVVVDSAATLTALAEALVLGLVQAGVDARWLDEEQHAALRGLAQTIRICGTVPGSASRP